MATTTLYPLWDGYLAVHDLNGKQNWWNNVYWKETGLKVGTDREAGSNHTSVFRAIIRWDIATIVDFLAELQTARLQFTIKAISNSNGTFPGSLHKGRAPIDSQEHTTSWLNSGETNFMGQSRKWPAGDGLLASQASSGQADLVVNNASAYAADDYVTLDGLGANHEGGQIDSIASNTLTLKANLTNTHAAGTLVRAAVGTTVDFLSLSGQKVLRVASTAGMSVGDGVALWDVSVGAPLWRGNDTSAGTVISSIDAGVSITLDTNLNVNYVSGDRVCVWTKGAGALWITSGGDYQVETAGGVPFLADAADIFYRIPTTGWTNPDTASAWAVDDVVKIGQGSNVLLLGISGTTHATNPPTNEAQSWIETQAADFQRWMIGHTFDFSGGGSYTIVEFDEDDRTKIRVNGNASTEGTGISYTVDGQTEDEQQQQVKDWLQECDNDWGGSNYTLAYVWAKLDGLIPYDDPPNDDVPGEGYYADPDDMQIDYIEYYSDQDATQANHPQLITRLPEGGMKVNRKGRLETKVGGLLV